MARPRQISDEQILATMKELVLQHGPSVSLDVVAEKLGVTSPALLKRFGSRKTLLVQALRPPARPEWMNALEKGPDGRSLVVQLEEVFSSIFGYFRQVLPCLTALRESGISVDAVFDKNEPQPLRGIRSLKAWLLSAQKAKLIETDAPESIATAMVGALQAKIFVAHLMQQPISLRSQQQYVRDLALLFARGLQPQGASKNT